ncbi:MAG: 23S rRNA (uracil(1939)-C(5))-methyltransferase RlmD [Rhabdochlamydiaceae bacterium]|nr:23S rRNA (uracil(1939)-C(5))-methyltransferase RlmD [Candidatus Amphrikana amoebophyrae]
MSAKYSQGMDLTLDIERLGINGEGVAHHNKMTIFVEGALPDEKVIATITETRRTFQRAKIKKILIPSDYRVDPICPLFGTCGGCQIMHLSYEMQLLQKQKRVKDAFERIGKLNNITVHPTHPSPSQFEYRNKIALPLTKHLQLGLYKKGSHDIIPVDHCYIHTPLGEKAFSLVAKLIREKGLKEIKHVIIRTAIKSNQLLIVLVTHKSLTPRLSSEVKSLYDEMDEIKGIIHNENSGHGNRIMGKKFTTIIGEGEIEDEICSLRFKVSPSSFFQVNPLQAELLYQKAIELAEFSGSETLLDAYCGVGTLALIASPFVKKVIGVECVAPAIADAKQNAKLNNINNVSFFADHAEDFIKKQKNLDIAFINPPRKGCDKSFLDSIIALSPKKLIYISCDPATLARDLRILEDGGYQIHEAHPFDMFPQTSHVECVVSLSKK